MHENLFFINLFKITAKYWSTVLQTAPAGAVCSTVDQYLATICVKKPKHRSQFSSGLERVYCIIQMNAGTIQREDKHKQNTTLQN